MENVNNLIRQEMKPIEFVRFLYWALLDSNGNIRKTEDFDSDFIYLLKKSGFKDSEERVNFCIQLVNWLDKSEYLNTTTKEFIRFNGGCGMRTFFENRNKKIARYNMYKEENEIEIPIENINTLVSRVTADMNRLLMIFDREVYNNIFIEEESSYWKVYKRNFLDKASKSSYMTIDLGDFGFEIPYDRIITTAPNDREFKEMLNVIALYSKTTRSKVMGLVNNSCWGYLLYLCSCEPQKRKDKENYALVQEIINGSYNEISKDMIEVSEVVEREERLDKLEQSLLEKEKELDYKLSEIREKEERFIENSANNTENSEVLKKIVGKLEELANGPEEKCQENLSKLVQLLKNKGL